MGIHLHNKDDPSKLGRNLNEITLQKSELLWIPCREVKFHHTYFTYLWTKFLITKEIRPLDKIRTLKTTEKPSPISMTRLRKMVSLSHYPQTSRWKKTAPSDKRNILKSHQKWKTKSGNPLSLEIWSGKCWTAYSGSVLCAVPCLEKPQIKAD